MYSPKIKDELVKRLHRLKESRRPRKPLTFYVNSALEEYLIKKEEELDKITDH